MRHGMRRRALAGIVALVGMAAIAPAASASINPSMSVTSGSPATAGSSGSLGLDLRFNPSAGDAPDSVTLNLPPGVLANASTDGGACIRTAISDFSDDTACQIGSGVVTALASGLVPVPTNVFFYLTPPPVSGDLAGLAVATGAGDQIGVTDGISIRPSGSSDGVGVTLDLTLPDNLSGAPIAVSEINSTFTGIRFPTTCPSTPANVTMSANGYGSPSTSATASAPLRVTGCGALPYAPTYALTAVRDAHDKVVSIKTTITQAADEAPNASVSLAFPMASLSPSIAALHELCSAGVASGRCTPVGSVTADSPDYPTPLTGQAYLTGTLTGVTLTLVFPAPFPLTLVGSVNLTDNVTTFTGLPDIPLTSLIVSLDGGPSGLFDTNCQVPTNTSTATLTDQNGDKSAKPSSRFTISGCPNSTSNSGSGSSGSGSGSVAAAHVSTTTIRGLKAGHPTLRFTLTTTRRTNVKSFTVKLPTGLSLRTHKGHVPGLTIKGAKIKTETVRHGVLHITLKKAVHKVTVTITARGLKESKTLRDQATARSTKKRLKRLKLTITAHSTKGKRITIHVTTKNLGL